MLYNSLEIEMDDNNVYKEAVQLVILLLKNTSPEGNSVENIYPLGAFNQSEKTIYYYNNLKIFDLLVTREVIRVIRKRTDKVYKISFRRKMGEDFLSVIRYGDFSWDKRYGTWEYNNKSYSVKPGTGQYRLINMFMENPNLEFTEEQIIDTYGNERSTPAKRTKNDLIKELKELLKIPKKYFIPTVAGYVFKP